MATTKEPYLIQRHLSSARRILFTVTSFLDKRNIPYHLEGGALLGIVRDHDLLPWDNDVDISIPNEYAASILSLKFPLLLKGYRISIRKSTVDLGPIKKGQYSIFKIKPIFAYYLRWILPRHESIVMDIFVKTKDDTHTYWQAVNKVMRVENKYYSSCETIEYKGHSLKAPNLYREYLTQKYGDWSVPVKEWDCSEHELTIFSKSS